ncbi:MAG: serine hydrolase domain-containing protein [Candidatus Levyibacteriota bacterium]
MIKKVLPKMLFTSVATSALLFSAIAPAFAAESLLQQDMNALHTAGNVGAVAEVVNNGESTQVRSGSIQLDGDKKVPFNAHFRTGSDTKTMVATILLQLEGEGKLSLDDSVEKWLPGVVDGNGYDGSKITVRELLQHTSGIFDYTTDSGFEATFLTPEEFLANRTHHYEPRDLINIALSHPPVFAPGTNWSYSNTNYIIAGEVIKAVTGNTWDKELKKRIINPLGLDGTSVPGDSLTIPGPNAEGYNIYTSDPATRVYTDTTEDNMTWGGSAGAVITTTHDENRFLSALLKGKLLKPTQLAEMKNTVDLGPGIGYGLGLLHETFPCSNGNTGEFWGHDGGVIGYTTYVLGTPDGNRNLTLSLSTTTFSEYQYANDSGSATSSVLLDVFCGTSAPSGVASPQSQSVTSSPSIMQGLQKIRGPLL